MSRKNKRYKFLTIILLFQILQIIGVEMIAQNTSILPPKDSINVKREAPKARARRHRLPNNNLDSLKNDSIKKSRPELLKNTDSLLTTKTQIADSLELINKKELRKIEQRSSIVMQTDSIPQPKPLNKKLFIPNPTKATWLALVFPGAGQIYNRKYWKLPIIYGGFAGCAYALSWNGKMYKDYSQAYIDIMDDNPNTKSYEDLLPPNSHYNTEQLKSTLKRRKDTFRRYRDLSIFAFIGVYLISVIDAYVDAELSNFDISPDLSMRLEPAVIENNNQYSLNNIKNKSVGLQCVLRF